MIIIILHTGIFQGGKCAWIRHQPSFRGMLYFHGSDPKSTFHFHKLKWRNFVCFVIRQNSICSLEILKYIVEFFCASTLLDPRGDMDDFIWSNWNWDLCGCLCIT